MENTVWLGNDADKSTAKRQFCKERRTPLPGSPAGVFLLSLEVAALSVRFEVKDYNLLQKKLDQMREAPTKVMNSITAEARKRVPGWVATEVTKAYGVKKSEITGQKIGKVKTTGNNIRKVKVIYTGRLLTPTHFSMSPKAPKDGGGSYTLKATIIKGQRTTLGKVKKLTKKQRAALGKNFTKSGTQTSDHSPVMLMRAKGGQHLPFQRKSRDRKDIDAIKTVSLPQMVSSERTAEGIQQAINENLGKRLDHYMERYMPKK